MRTYWRVSSRPMIRHTLNAGPSPGRATVSSSRSGRRRRTAARRHRSCRGRRGRSAAAWWVPGRRGRAPSRPRSRARRRWHRRWRRRSACRRGAARRRRDAGRSTPGTSPAGRGPTSTRPTGTACDRSRTCCRRRRPRRRRTPSARRAIVSSSPTPTRWCCGERATVENRGVSWLSSSVMLALTERHGTPAVSARIVRGEVVAADRRERAGNADQPRRRLGQPAPHRPGEPRARHHPVPAVAGEVAGGVVEVLTDEPGVRAHGRHRRPQRHGTRRG